ncbi:MAG: methyltransferase domain-containing protein [Chloroflexota bacterium]
MRTLLRFFFDLLYHPFAFTYDLVAFTVSLGRWKDWVLSVVPFIEGTRILEIGHGPGHLQRVLLSRNLVAVGMDESAPMGRLAKRNLARQAFSAKHPNSNPSYQHSYTQSNLTRGIAQYLPFSTESFETVIATFPSEYIADARTLPEVKRCLTNGGRFIVLPVAMLMGRGILDRLMSLLFRVTHQSPEDPLEIFSKRFERPFIEAGFQVKIKQVEVKSSLLVIVIATKPSSR